MNNILKDFLQTEVFQKIQDVNDIIDVMIGGSNAFGIVDERTDYDIIIHVNGKVNNLDGYYEKHSLVHKTGANLHWYLQNEEVFQTPKAGLFWSMAIYSHKEDQVYIQNEYEYHKKIQNKKERLIKSFRFELEQPDNILTKITEANEIKQEFFSKDLYRYLAAWYWIKNKEITESQVKWLNKLKRIRWLEDFEEQHRNELKETLKELQEAVLFFKKM